MNNNAILVAGQFSHHFFDGWLASKLEGEEETHPFFLEPQWIIIPCCLVIGKQNRECILKRSGTMLSIY